MPITYWLSISIKHKFCTTVFFIRNVNQYLNLTMNLLITNKKQISIYFKVKVIVNGLLMVRIGPKIVFLKNRHPSFFITTSFSFLKMTKMPSLEFILYLCNNNSMYSCIVSFIIPPRTSETGSLNHFSFDSGANHSARTICFHDSVSNLRLVFHGKHV